jgi:hypothetical protein
MKPGKGSREELLRYSWSWKENFCNKKYCTIQNTVLPNKSYIEVHRRGKEIHREGHKEHTKVQ